MKTFHVKLWIVIVRNELTYKFKYVKWKCAHTQKVFKKCTIWYFQRCEMWIVSKYAGVNLRLKMSLDSECEVQTKTLCKPNLRHTFTEKHSYSIDLGLKLCKCNLWELVHLVHFDSTPSPEYMCSTFSESFP